MPRLNWVKPRNLDFRPDSTVSNDLYRNVACTGEFLPGLLLRLCWVKAEFESLGLTQQNGTTECRPSLICFRLQQLCYNLCQSKSPEYILNVAALQYMSEQNFQIHPYNLGGDFLHVGSVELDTPSMETGSSLQKAWWSCQGLVAALCLLRDIWFE